MVDFIWNTRVRKHNLRCLENKMNMIVWELWVLVFALCTTKERGMNGVVHDVKVY